MGAPRPRAEAFRGVAVSPGPPPSPPRLPGLCAADYPAAAVPRAGVGSAPDMAGGGKGARPAGPAGGGLALRPLELCPPAQSPGAAERRARSRGYCVAGSGPGRPEAARAHPEPTLDPGSLSPTSVGVQRRSSTHSPVVQEFQFLFAFEDPSNSSTQLTWAVLAPRFLRQTQPVWTGADQGFGLLPAAKLAASFPVSDGDGNGIQDGSRHFPRPTSDGDPGAPYSVPPLSMKQPEQSSLSPSVQWGSETGTVAIVRVG
nr:TSC22 domain family protein 2-like [Manis javanica]